ncbi:hypothetical protein, partial [Eggerthella lenta]
LDYYSQIESGISLYLPDGACIPAYGKIDEGARETLDGTDRKNGIIDPHISSVTGVNVFDLFVRVTLQDGVQGYLVKEY